MNVCVGGGMGGRPAFGCGNATRLDAGLLRDRVEIYYEITGIGLISPPTRVPVSVYANSAQ